MGKKKKLEVVNNGYGRNSDEGYSRVDRWNHDSTIQLSEYYKGVLQLLVKDAEREGLKETPLRVAKAIQFMMQGYQIDPEEIIATAKFKEDYQQMVIVKDIEIYSICEHHMIPFFGKAHIAYIPNGYITGLSKLARVAEAYSRRLQVQERLTYQIRDCIQETLEPLGVGVVIEAQHLCMMMRGIQKQNSVTTTSAFTGEFLKDPTREEFIHIIGSTLH